MSELMDTKKNACPTTVSTRRELFRATLLLSAALMSFAESKARTALAPLKKSSRVLYLVPKDRHPNPECIAAIEATVKDLQFWYYSMLNGKTFVLNTPLVEVHRTERDAAQYDVKGPTSGEHAPHYTFRNALADAEKLVGAKQNDPDYTWLIYVDAPGQTGAGLMGVAVLPEHELQGIMGQNPADKRVSRWQGGHCHELGHAFGLNYIKGAFHRKALMYLGYLDFPYAYLTEQDLATLHKSPFLVQGKPASITQEVFVYRDGCFLNRGNRVWEERQNYTDVVSTYKELSRDDSEIVLLDAQINATIYLPRAGGLSYITTSLVPRQPLHKVRA
jgi:hypothetical protein